MFSKNLPVFNDFANITGKRVIVRVDFNVPVEEEGGRITDDYRLIKTVPLLKRLSDAGARLVLLSHLTEKKTHRSFKPLLEGLQENIGLPLELAYSIQDARNSVSRVVLLENLRVFRGEEENSPEFAKELASLGDIFINEGFSQSHRPYASVVGLPQLLPSFVGPLFYEEVSKLQEVFEPEHPFMLILGGVKFTTKMGVLEHFMTSADVVFVCGALANTFLAARGIEVGTSSTEEDMMPRVRDIFQDRENLILPEDVLVEGNEVRRVDEIQKEDFIYDAGPKTILSLIEKIRDMRMILWNGPLGLVEEGYTQGTIDLITVLANCSAKVVIGGGDTIGFIRKQKIEKDFYYLSTGGGAMLDFLAKGTLPGIDAILAGNQRI
ncbi:MAG: phosphoglycerate kinase [Candidatus Ryanbacteria bacterium RIFCSPHIGHO2_02_FULL_45_17b]|uniref:Phosphoglycerate kinase n=1 Tax=Candidatus Ryanbacteria bacterium RIFCSPHIGHO2_01_FULL_45_22 TaxID=1802114 RepID=A0A1G2G1I2_9BACT|nr:MAG: phosphoglycerate kinase [Candidatus Ryanbacteria bacterium RIFCSPHIGHO2_01_FULL_45_22]OGZ46471.1 MAG: phosphoglycerate kinase [Candidatus Ryanbacteria bacterium RIFCSPHIGHO2_02_FULL_45_17b]